MSLDPNAVVNGFEVKEDEDAGHRQREFSGNGLPINLIASQEFEQRFLTEMLKGL